MYPLRFRPIFRRYLWGSRRLHTVLGKPIDDSGSVAESWEVVDHGADQSVVLAGALAGKTLHELVSRWPRELLGTAARGEAFPLLFKFLDANQPLSVQVHPNDAQAARLHPPDQGKTEAWFILHAEPGSVLYVGLKRGVDRAAFERELQRGTAELCLQRIEPRVGDCFFIPAGLVHALGAGLVVAEIQQSSDTTFRLYDWNRVGPDGRPRELHIEQGLPVIDFGLEPVAPQRPQPTQRAHVVRLVDCDKFVWDQWRFCGRESLGGNGHCHLVAVVQGNVQVEGDPLKRPLRCGETMLLPAACGPAAITAAGECMLLDASVPCTPEAPVLKLR